MINKEELQVIDTLVKPQIFERIVELEAILDELDYIDHHLPISNMLTHDIGSPKDRGTGIEEIYIGTAKQILELFGVSLSEEEELNFIVLVDIIKAMQDLVEEDARDVLDAASAEYEDGIELLVNTLPQVSELSMGQLLSYISDFDDTQILSLKRLFDVSLDEEELKQIADFSKRFKTYYKVQGEEKIAVAANFIRSREPSQAFGYSFELACQANWSILEDFGKLKKVDRLAYELVGIALGSTAVIEQIKYEIENILDRMGLDFALMAKVGSKVESIVAGLESYEEK